MGALIVLQDLITVEGDASVNNSIHQPGRAWADIANWSTAIITVEVPSVVKAMGDTVAISIRTMGQLGDPSLVADGGTAIEV